MYICLYSYNIIASKRSSKVNSKKDRKSKIKEPEPEPIVEEEPVVEPIVEEKPPEAEEKKVELSQENIEIQNSILNNVLIFFKCNIL